MKDINLIPPQYLQEKIDKKKKRLRTSIIVGLVLVLVLGSAGLFKVRYDLQKTKAAWEGKARSNANYAAAGQEFDYIRSLCQKRAETAKSLAGKGIDVPALMRHIEQSSPRNLLLGSVTVSGGDPNQFTIIINGFVPAEKDINTLVYRLEKDVYFDSVKVTTAKRVETSEGSGQMFNFIISLTINNSAGI